MTLLGLHRPDVVVRSPPAALRNAAPALGRQPGRWGVGWGLQTDALERKTEV